MADKDKINTSGQIHHHDAAAGKAADGTKDRAQYATQPDLESGGGAVKKVPQNDAAHEEVARAASHVSASDAKGRVLSPQVNVEGGKCTISHFHLLHASVGLGQGEDASNMISFPPSAINTLVITTKDQRGRHQLATLLEGIAGQLRGA